jgi:hypothetical protein
MTIVALFPFLLWFLTRLSTGSGYSFNINTVTASSKTTYSAGWANFGSGLDASQDFNGDGFNDILICSWYINAAYLFSEESQLHRPLRQSCSPGRLEITSFTTVVDMPGRFCGYYFWSTI